MLVLVLELVVLVDGPPSVDVAVGLPEPPLSELLLVDPHPKKQLKDKESASGANRLGTIMRGSNARLIPAPIRRK